MPPTFVLRRDKPVAPDLAGRPRRYRRNFELFGAPVGLVFSLDRRFGPAQRADLGACIQTFLVLASVCGLDTCTQVSWASGEESCSFHGFG